ncbi:MAG: ATP-binding protein [Nocardioidaceae bacterium]
MSESADRAMPDTTSWSVPFAPCAVQATRADVADMLLRRSMPQHVVDDTCVVVSELLGNAVQHARPIPGGGLIVRIEIADETVTVSVVDGGSPTLPTLLHGPDLSPRGRGLAIVRKLTKEWGVREAPAGNTVFGVLAVV